MANARQLWLTSADMRSLSTAVRVLVNKVSYGPLFDTRYGPLYDMANL